MTSPLRPTLAQDSLSNRTNDQWPKKKVERRSAFVLAFFGLWKFIREECLQTTTNRVFLSNIFSNLLLPYSDRNLPEEVSFSLYKKNRRLSRLKKLSRLEFSSGRMFDSIGNDDPSNTHRFNWDSLCFLLFSFSLANFIFTFQSRSAISSFNKSVIAAYRYFASKIELILSNLIVCPSVFKVIFVYLIIFSALLFEHGKISWIVNNYNNNSNDNNNSNNNNNSNSNNNSNFPALEIFFFSLVYFVQRIFALVCLFGKPFANCVGWR